MMFYCYHPSPLGPLLLAADEQGLRLLYMDVHQRPVQADWRLATNELDEARRQLDEYFARRREVFDLTLAPVGTPFQQQVWQALLRIPMGTPGLMANRRSTWKIPRRSARWARPMAPTRFPSSSPVTVWWAAMEHWWGLAAGLKTR